MEITPEQVLENWEKQFTNEELKTKFDELKRRYQSVGADGNKTLYAKTWGYIVFLMTASALDMWMPQAVMTGNVVFPTEMGTPDPSLLEQLSKDCQEWLKNYCVLTNQEMEYEVTLVKPEFTQYEASALYKATQPYYYLSVQKREKEQENVGKTI